MRTRGEVAALRQERSTRANPLDLIRGWKEGTRRSKKCRQVVGRTNTTPSSEVSSTPSGSSWPRRRRRRAPSGSGSRRGGRCNGSGESDGPNDRPVRAEPLPPTLIAQLPNRPLAQLTTHPVSQSPRRFCCLPTASCLLISGSLQSPNRRVAQSPSSPTRCHLPAAPCQLLRFYTPCRCAIASSGGVWYKHVSA